MMQELTIWSFFDIFYFSFDLIIVKDAGISTLTA